MKFFLAATLLGSLSMVAASNANAQSGPAFPTPGQSSSEAGARRNNGNNAEELLRNQRRAAMTPDQIKEDQQLELLQARTGNTSFGRTNGSPDRQFDSNRSGQGFMVRKYKAKKGFSELKRGMSHSVGGSNPPGKPLVHKSKMKKKLFLF